MKLWKQLITLGFIPVMIFPIFLWGLYFNNPIYITLISFFCSYLFLINVPKLTQFVHEKPLYIEDLSLSVEIEQQVKLKFKEIFIRVMEITLALVICGLVNYTFYKLSTSSLDLFEKVALFGGVLSLYNDIQNNIGRVLLFIINYNKENYEKKNERKSLYFFTGTKI